MHGQHKGAYVGRHHDGPEAPLDRAAAGKQTPVAEQDRVLRRRGPWVLCQWVSERLSGKHTYRKVSTNRHYAFPKPISTIYLEGRAGIRPFAARLGNSSMSLVPVTFSLSPSLSSIFHPSLPFSPPRSAHSVPTPPRLSIYPSHPTQRNHTPSFRTTVPHHSTTQHKRQGRRKRRKRGREEF